MLLHTGFEASNEPLRGDAARETKLQIYGYTSGHKVTCVFYPVARSNFKLEEFFTHPNLQVGGTRQELEACGALEDVGFTIAEDGNYKEVVEIPSLFHYLPP